MVLSALYYTHQLSIAPNVCMEEVGTGARRRRHGRSSLGGSWTGGRVEGEDRWDSLWHVDGGNIIHW